MGLQEKIIPQLVHYCILLLFVVHGSRGLDLAPSPALSADPPHAREIASSPADLPNPQTVYAPAPTTLPKGSDSHAPVALPPSFEAAGPTINPLVPTVKPPAPSTHSAIEHNSPSVISPSTDSPANSPIRPGHDISPSYVSPPPKSEVSSSVPISNSPVMLPQAPAPPRILPVNPPSIPSIVRITPSAPPAGSTVNFHGHATSPSSLSPLTHGKSHGTQVAPPPMQTRTNISPVIHSPLKGSSPLISPVPHKAEPPVNTKNAPLNSHAHPPKVGIALGPASAPTVPTRQHTPREKVPKHVFAPSYPPPYIPGPVISPPPKVVSTNRKRHHAAPPLYQGPSDSSVQSPSSSALSPIPSNPYKGPNHRPSISPSGPLSTGPRAPVAQPVWALPPPPPNLDCNSLSCTEPLIDPPIGSPCVCVLPIKVELRLSVALYSFFPLVSDFAQEIASGVDMKQRQVRVMGANVASEQPEKTIILMDLVPLQEKFDNSTAFQTFEKFWHKQVAIKASLFGDYEVLYVLYPGLPSSPPTAPANVNVEDGQFGNNRNARAMKPLGVDVRKPKRKANGSFIAIVVLSSFLGLLLCIGATLLLVLKWGDHFDISERFQHSLLPQFAKSSGTGHVILGTRHSSTSASFSSSIATYTGQAKTFKLSDIERATNFFDDSRILGEGGFGCVYRGELEDGTRAAVKVLKRYDCQGEREFLSEVEMLSRLHHRNLVKLIGICIEENARCLIYELIPNGSVESHLHGLDKETAPLDWNARMKIALGAARGLAYLHEDSNPRVIHRDFKSSNILLEHDFTSKVSDFGLARTAMDEGNRHISTRVMGTFGYVAPEYAMTGHLLVKSDVYSYGVVLLELLTGRKPVDMSRPAGQENLVTWARPLLTSVDGLEEIIDPSLGAEVQFDSVAKVAAIASMCVQPEVSHRPFMGEVVQALKLVCSECNSQEGLSGPVGDISNGTGMEAERVLLSDMFGTSPMSSGDEHGSFHRHSCSGPLMTGKSKQFWQRLRSLRTGSMSDHGLDSLGVESHSDGSGHGK